MLWGSSKLKTRGVSQEMVLLPIYSTVGPDASKDTHLLVLITLQNNRENKSNSRSYYRRTTV